MTPNDLLSHVVKSGGGDAVFFSKPVTASLTKYSQPVVIVALVPMGKRDLLALDNNGNYIEVTDRAGAGVIEELFTNLTPAG
jgi:hypothetical protein